ncbi:hypothetical protein HS088_TW09G01268 [Tripterygium wilfordii]|uniref:Uncharacterized protein n=1 Tax=Tripterygium wilfordii TaxID=458696 RepID=A0A7J7DA30_TRIWF|nr:hypothetical protein HS088_TW09G01268 [Tripterygium wilfordii]
MPSTNNNNNKIKQQITNHRKRIEVPYLHPQKWVLGAKSTFVSVNNRTPFEFNRLIVSQNNGEFHGSSAGDSILALSGSQVAIERAPAVDSDIEPQQLRSFFKNTSYAVI